MKANDVPFPKLPTATYMSLFERICPITMTETPRTSQLVDPSLLLSLQRMPQQFMAYSPDEDWSGVTNPAARRRLQNRLNQRAYRLRRQGQDKRATQTDGAHIESAGHHHPTPVPTPAKALAHHDSITCGLSELQHLECTFAPPNIHDLMAQFERRAMARYAEGSPKTDLLLNLSRLNVLRAAYQNVVAIGMTVEWMCQDTNRATPPMARYLPNSTNAG
ncbi:unnamed protein product [Aspergillus oryzae RIB40]|nr:unnamed protein product [Aspergillus oryzae RIB40]BAE62475.1 unnamed protein product [Aspergillus oryzae RIB40]